MDDFTLRIETDTELDVLEMALQRFIREHVEDYPYHEDPEDYAADVRANREADVMEASGLLLRLDLMRDSAF